MILTFSVCIYANNLFSFSFLHFVWRTLLFSLFFSYVASSHAVFHNHCIPFHIYVIMAFDVCFVHFTNFFFIIPTYKIYFCFVFCFVSVCLLRASFSSFFLFGILNELWIFSPFAKKIFHRMKGFLVFFILYSFA